MVLPLENFFFFPSESCYVKALFLDKELAETFRVKNETAKSNLATGRL